MVSSRTKTPSGAAEAIPMPTEMDSRAVENERRLVTMVGRTVETERRMVAMADGTTAETGRVVETASHRERGRKKGSASEHCLSKWGKSTCP